MPTPLDRALQSRNALLGFAGIVTAAAAWSIWAGDIFPVEKDPTGDPSTWTVSQLQRWLHLRGLLPSRNSGNDTTMTREELLERVRVNMRPPPRAGT